MEDVKVIFAGNLIRLRTQRQMTQAELAEKIHYSDKSVSKWERAEALPDIGAAQNLAEQLGVTVDYLVTSHDEWKAQAVEPRFSTGIVTTIAVFGVWVLALLLFVIFWILGKYVWLIFAAAAPVSLIVLLVLNSIWHGNKGNLWIVSALVLSLFLLLYLALLPVQLWQLFLLVIPAELLVFFSFRIKTGLRIKRKKTGKV